MAGYSGTPLIKKLGIKEGFKVGVVNAPKSFGKALGKLPAKSTLSSNLTGSFDVIILFAGEVKGLEKQFAIVADKLSANGSLWIAWPKKSSSVATDLSFNVVQLIGLNYGLVDVKICAIDETWSGLKFVYRLKDRSSVKVRRN
jgi:hypothetical protein